MKWIAWWLFAGTRNAMLNTLAQVLVAAGAAAVMGVWSWLG